MTPLSYAINSFHRYMHPKAPPLSRRIALGWLFLISRTAAGFSLSPPPAKKFPSSAYAISPSHHRHSYKAASSKSYNQISAAHFSSNSNVAEASVMIDQLPTTKWADVFSHRNPNYSPQHLFPPFSSSSHKGSHGRIAILGGSNKYTGAPYYAAQAALNCGVDLGTVFCAEEVGYTKSVLLVSYHYFAPLYITHMLVIPGFYPHKVLLSRTHGTRSLLNRTIRCTIGRRGSIITRIGKVQTQE